MANELYPDKAYGYADTAPSTGQSMAAFFNNLVTNMASKSKWEMEQARTDKRTVAQALLQGLLAKGQIGAPAGGSIDFGGGFGSFPITPAAIDYSNVKDRMITEGTLPASPQDMASNIAKIVMDPQVNMFAGKTIGQGKDAVIMPTVDELINKYLASVSTTKNIGLAPTGMIRVKEKKTGRTGKIASSEFDPSLYERIE